MHVLRSAAPLGSCVPSTTGGDALARCYDRPMVRRLPVFSSSADEDERPTWQWTAIGVLFACIIFGTLAMPSNWVRARLIDHMAGDMASPDLERLFSDGPAGTRALLWLATAGPSLVTFAFGCWSAGALIGRFGARVTPRGAAIAGALTSLVAALFVLLPLLRDVSLAGLWLLVALGVFALLLPIGALAAWLGGRFGVRLRNRSFLRPPPPAAGGRPNRNV